MLSIFPGKEVLTCALQVGWRVLDLVCVLWMGWVGGAPTVGVTQGHGGARGAPLLSRVVAKRGAASQPL